MVSVFRDPERPAWTNWKMIRWMYKECSGLESNLVQWCTTSCSWQFYHRCGKLSTCSFRFSLNERWRHPRKFRHAWSATGFWLGPRKYWKIWWRLQQNYNPRSISWCNHGQVPFNFPNVWHDGKSKIQKCYCSFGTANGMEWKPTWYCSKSCSTNRM